MTSSIYQSFKAFKKQSVFQREALRLMVKLVPEEKIEKMKELFLDLDKSGTGLIKIDELVKSMNALENMNEFEVKDLISTMDVNNTGYINYSEFISAAMHAKKEIIEEALWLTFKQLDIDNKGQLTEDSLRRSTEAIGRHFNPDQIQSIIETVNSTGGMITYENFKEIIMGNTGVS